MAKKKSKDLQPKEASVTVLQRIAKALLNSKNQKALELGEELLGLNKGVEKLPEEVFDSLGAKFEKKAGELMPQSDNDLLERLEKIATQLEKQPLVPQGLAGVHSVQQIQELAKELADLKQQTASVQQTQQNVQLAVQDVKEASKEVQQALQAATAQVEYVQKSTIQVEKTSSSVLSKVESQTAQLLEKFNEAASLTANVEATLKEQIEASFILTLKEQEQRDVFLQNFEQKVEEELQNITKVSKQRFTQLDDSVADFEDGLEGLKKVLKTPMDSMVGQMNNVKQELAQIQAVTAFLESKAKESLQLVEADEDEGYVTEAVELVRVLVDRLYVGAQLYAKHRETIEAIERGEREQSEWEKEKHQYENSMDEISKLKMNVSEQSAKIRDLEDSLKREKNKFENKANSFEIDALHFMAKTLPIENWPGELAQKVEEASIQVHEEFKLGAHIDVTADNMTTVQRYVDLPNESYGKVILLTSAYYEPNSKKVIQKAKSEVAVEQTT